MIPNFNRATERTVAPVDLLIDALLRFAPEDDEQFDPRAFLLEIAARSIAKAVLSYNAEHEQAAQLSVARSADLIAAGPLPESPLQAWAERGEWGRLIGWFGDESHKKLPDEI
jgi:hypothetical protein